MKRNNKSEPMAMPQNCFEVNGYWVCQSDGEYNLFDPSQKCWFGFDFKDKESAQRACNALAGNKG